MHVQLHVFVTKLKKTRFVYDVAMFIPSQLAIEASPTLLLNYKIRGDVLDPSQSTTLPR